MSTAVRTATTALLEADIHLAEQVIIEDERLDAKQAEVERRAFSLLARQAPVAGELRIIVATLRMVTELERMGDLAAHVAKIARLRYPEIRRAGRVCGRTSSGWATSPRRWSSPPARP